MFKFKDKDTVNLEKMLKMMEVISITTQFIQDDDGIIRSHVLNIISGEKVITSNPIELQWPLQPMPMPKALKGKCQ